MNKQLRAKKSRWCRTHHKRCATVYAIGASVVGLFGILLATDGAPMFGGFFMLMSFFMFVDALQSTRRHLQQKRKDNK